MCERLEPRCVLSAASASEFQAVIVAGDPNGSPADSPANRIDPNTASSPFAGVGSLQINTRRGSYICTGTPIEDGTRLHVLTAGHCIDLNNDGRSNRKDGITSIYFNLNVDQLESPDAVDYRLQAASWTTHPDFTGFNRPSVNDDLAVITLGASLPAGVPTYPLASTDMAAGSTHLYMVGYGRSGDGVNGYTTDASWTIKREGENIVDAFYGQDESSRPAGNEVFRFDFDGPSGNGPMGGATLGNDRETTLGGGDSGGPSFALVPATDTTAEHYVLVGVNTFTQGLNAPKFGSLGGGINVYPYRGWILGTSSVSGTSSSGSPTKGSAERLGGAFFAVDAALPLESFHDTMTGAFSTFTAASRSAWAAVGQPATRLRGDSDLRAGLVVLEPAFAALAADQQAIKSGPQARNWIADEDRGLDANPDDLVVAIDAILSHWYS